MVLEEKLVCSRGEALGDHVGDGILYRLETKVHTADGDPFSPIDFAAEQRDGSETEDQQFSRNDFFHEKIQHDDTALGEDPETNLEQNISD